MNIARIHIENLRSIASLDLDLTAADGSPRRRVILLGGNGCGKTSTVLAIANAFDLRSDHYFQAPRLGAGDIRRIDGGFDDPSSSARGHVEIEVCPSRDDREWWVGNNGTEKLPERETLRLELRRRQDPPFSISVQIIIGRANPPAVLLPATRGPLEEVPLTPIESLNEFRPLEMCLSLDRQRFQLIPGLLALAYMAPEHNDRDGVVRRMWKVLAKYFPKMPRPVGVRGLQVLFETDDGAVVRLSRLSDGQRALLLILGELALRNPAGGIVLIDEIEQHLHPRWQRALLDALVALLPTAQFIITTQAPYLAASAPDDVITLGDWHRDGPQ